jgi:hypothetical protein
LEYSCSQAVKKPHNAFLKADFGLILPLTWSMSIYKDAFSALFSHLVPHGHILAPLFDLFYPPPKDGLARLLAQLIVMTHYQDALVQQQQPII